MVIVRISGGFLAVANGFAFSQAMRAKAVPGVAQAAEKLLAKTKELLDGVFASRRVVSVLLSTVT